MIARITNGIKRNQLVIFIIKRTIWNFFNHLKAIINALIA